MLWKWETEHPFWFDATAFFNLQLNKLSMLIAHTLNGRNIYLQSQFIERLDK